MFPQRHFYGTRCALAYCDSTYVKNSPRRQLSFFGFPKDPERRALWIEKCNPEFLPITETGVLEKKYKLCSLHFTDTMFSNSAKNRLVKYAIPNVFKNDVFVKSDTVESIEVPEDETLVESPSFVVDEITQCTTTPDYSIESDYSLWCDKTFSLFGELADL